MSEEKSQGGKPKNWFARHKVITTILVLVVFFIIGSVSSNNGTPSSSPTGSTSDSTKPEAGLALPSVGKQIVTYDKYQQLQNGMSYDQVKTIIGADGEEVSRNEIGGFETVMYQWVNSNGSNMNAMFQNDGMMQKAQFGLK